MKSLFYAILLFVITSTILTSCYEIPSITLTKRHYRNGYNIEVNEKHKKTQIIKSNRSESVLQENFGKVRPQSALLKTSDENNIKYSPASFLNAPLKIKENKYKDSWKIHPKNKSNIHINKNPTYLSKTVSIVKTAIKKTTAYKYLIVKNKINNHEGEHLHGGLIWTLICVFFVLWLLSLLTGGWGLGAFIHMFLIVALVLILLRLLWVI